ncbi:hypothetical protein LSH36_441g01057 [Paralvinella palmiformis]|uniref:Uncharacterized protein n=1 Tax=Paralvinella palmiformis TaxID=53620 RepID=A0AAD9JAX6_9ANNE|nr:hypothetical protein LSH36_441g01057 [Paralvinella palmiformis]
MVDVGCMVDLVEGDRKETITPNHVLNTQITELENRIITLSNENEFLAHRIKAMEREAETIKALRQKSSTPLVSPITTPHKQTQAITDADQESQCMGDDLPQSPKHEQVEKLTNQSDSGSQTAVSEDPVELSSQSDEQEDNNRQPTTGGTTVSGIDVELECDTTDSNHTMPNASVQKERSAKSPNSMFVEVGSVSRDQSLSMDQLTMNHSVPQPVIFTDMDSHIPYYLLSRISHSFQKLLMSNSLPVSNDNRIVSEICHMTENEDKVILILGRCLPNIVPNVILAKREELIPLILCTATLHPDAKLRDQLLNILFNLIKRPGTEQRRMILTGCVAFAKHVGPDRVETELLPQCWEQINHKYVERRLLVAEACGTLAPYIPHELRGSLVLSMLTQMLQFDKAEEVREAVVHSLGQLVLFIADTNKYNEGVQLLFTGLQDLSTRVQNGVKQVFLPAFAMWALLLGKLESDFLQSIVDKLETLVKGGEMLQKSNTSGVLPPDKQQFCLFLHSLQQLIPFMFMSILLTAPFVGKDKPNEEMLKHFSVSSRLPEPSSDLFDLCAIFGSHEHLANLVCLYEEYIGEEWYKPWDNFNWMAGQLIPQLLSLLNMMDVSCMTIVHQMSTLFFNICKTFGRCFTITKVKKKFQVVLSIPEEDTDTMLSAGKTPLSKCTVPVYAAGVLGSLTQDDDYKELAKFLKDLLLTLSLCHAPIDSLKAAVTELCYDPDNHQLLIGVLWDGVVHTSASVRSTSAQLFELLIKGVDECLVSSKVVPALVTLASDAEIMVRISTISAFGTIMETISDRSILDKVHMQFQTFMDDPMYSNQHDLHLELVATFGRVGPNAEPRFRDESGYVLSYTLLRRLSSGVLPVSILSHHNRHHPSSTVTLE